MIPLWTFNPRVIKSERNGKPYARVALKGHASGLLFDVHIG